MRQGVVLGIKTCFFFLLLFMSLYLLLFNTFMWEGTIEEDCNKVLRTNMKNAQKRVSDSLILCTEYIEIVYNCFTCYSSITWP